MASKKVREAIIRELSCTVPQASQSSLARTLYTEAEAGTQRCGVPAPCRRGTGASSNDRFAALGTERSAAERGGDGAARHPYLCFAAPGRNGCSRISPFCCTPQRFSERGIYSASTPAGPMVSNLFMPLAVGNLKRTEVRAPSDAAPPRYEIFGLAGRFRIVVVAHRNSPHI